VTSLFDLPFEDEPLKPEDLQPIDERPTPRGGPPAPSPVATEGSARLSQPGEAAAIAAPAERKPPHIFSVSEITHAVRQSLEHQFPRVWVEGEIADCSNNQGHVYFTLKDGSAQLPCVLWRTDAVRVRFKLTTGLHVLAKGRVSVFAPRGRYQLMVDAIEPRGEGALRLAFDQLRARLQAEGLFAPARKRPLPMLPRRIGVVTSLDGAALRDVIRVLRTRRAPAEIVISPTRVQGDGAAGEIARAIARVARVPDVDVVIVGRGGGSLEDLWAFNEEVVARAIAACPVPVIAAVGHEVDTTIADFVADVRAATPSQAAEIVVRQASEFRDRIATARRQLGLVLRARLDRRRTHLLRLEQRPAFARLRDRVLDRDRLRSDLDDRLHGALHARLDRRDRQVADLTRRLDEQHPQRQLITRLRRLTQTEERLYAAEVAQRQRAVATWRARRDRLARVGLDTRVAQASRRVDAHLARAAAALGAGQHARDRRLSALSAQLDALSPLKTLARGYAICWDAEGRDVVRSASAAPPGSHVRVQLPDGMLDCEVDAVTPVPAPRS
jgi:exodeoxyribonuclease VII large subunit